MKRITVFIGSARKGGTLEAVRNLEQNLKKIMDVQVEYVFLSKSNLKMCKGCKVCFDTDEKLCPINDEMKELKTKIDESDGVVFATPNYAFHVSGMMKNFIDRMAYTFHRPQYFGKTFTSIVAQGAFGGNKIVKYLSSTGENMGFQSVKGCVVKTLEPTPEKAKEANKAEIKLLSERFAKELSKDEVPSPSLFRLMMFRMTRHGIMAADENLKDHQYYKEKGWFESDYYYETSLGVTKKVMGKLFDAIGRKFAKNF